MLGLLLYLIEALENPRKATTRFEQDTTCSRCEIAVRAGLQISWERSESPEAARLMAQYVDHEDDDFRKHAALTLGTIGDSECIEPMLNALADEADYVRSYAMMGIQRGIEADRSTKGFLDAMFPALVGLLDRDDSSVSGTAPSLLLAIDADRAVPILLSPEYFTVENRKLRDIIRALNSAGHKIPHAKLLPLLAAIEPLVDEYPHDYEYAAALTAYAYNPDASAQDTFSAALRSRNAGIEAAAAEALATLAGITSALDIVFDAIDHLGFDGLTLPQKHYFAVFLYDDEVRNGGHSQYFVNSSGDFWKSAIEGLKAIDAPERATILQGAIVLFGATGPSENRDARHRQLARFSRRRDESLHALDSRYYACKENVPALLAQFTIQHAQHFSAKT